MKIRDLLHRLWAVGLLSVLLHAQYCVAVATALHAVLVHRYSFDNNTLSDSIGGPSFDATLLEGASVGSSVSVFTGADNDNKEYGMLIGPGLINTLPDLTIEVWYKSLYEDVVGAVASSSERLLCFDYVSVGREPALGRLMVEYSPLGHLSAASTSGSILNLTAPIPFDQPKKVHLVVTFTNNSFVRIYLNGDHVATSAWLFTLQGSSSASNYLGSCGKIDSTSYFHGKIDEIRIWSGSMTHSEIKCHFSEGPNSVNSEKCDRIEETPDRSRPVVPRNDSVFDHPPRETYKFSCSNGLPLPLWSLLLMAFLFGASAGAVVVIVCCRCVFGKYRNGVEYDALGHDDFLGEENGVSLKVII
jgi:hypothetical protein